MFVLRDGGRLASALECISSGDDLTPGGDRVEACLFFFPSQHLCRFISACLTFVCTVRTIAVRSDIPCPPFDKSRPNDRCHGNTQRMHNSGMIIMILIDNLYIALFSH